MVKEWRNGVVNKLALLRVGLVIGSGYEFTPEVATLKPQRVTRSLQMSQKPLLPLHSVTRPLKTLWCF
jgi:hypothetical protein